MLFIFAYSWFPGGLDVDSCNYSVVAKEILRSGNWLKLYDPVCEGFFYYHFPLCIWVTALIFKVFGVTSFAAKFFSMSSGVILTITIYYFGRKLKNNWVGFFGGVSFLITNHIVRLARESRMDIPVSLFITLALFCFVLAQRRSRWNYILFGLFTSLAILTKDVSGLVPLAVVFIYLCLRLKFKEFFNPLFILGLFFAALPVLIWMWLDERTLFNIWYNCNFLHVLSSHRFNVPWYYYIWAIATKYFYLLPFAIYGAYLALKDARLNKNYEFYLLIIWVLFIPIAFSFGRQKLHYLILPIYPAASLLVGVTCDKIFKEKVKEKIASSLKYILIIGSIIMLSFPVKYNSRRFIETVHLAPAIDQLLIQLPEYEFIVHKQDKSALLFYSQQLTRVESVREKEKLQESLLAPDNKVRFCYLSERDHSNLNPELRERCKVILKYKDRIIIVNQKDLKLPIILP